MKYKVGDKVRIKNIDWYNKNKSKSHGTVTCGGKYFDYDMREWCGKTMTILDAYQTCYIMKEDGAKDLWTDEMIEGLVKEETKFGTALNPIEPKSDANCITQSEVDVIKKAKIFWDGIKDAWICPEGYIFKDENGNIINAQKIVLEKKLDDKLKLESTKKVQEYWSEYTRIFIEIYDDEPNECILTHLLTLEGHRQKGYGKQALIQAEEIAKELGCHKAHLKVETNSWMHNWYLRCGYQWYKNANEGYTWLTKNL